MLIEGVEPSRAKAFVLSETLPVRHAPRRRRQGGRACRESARHGGGVRRRRGAGAGAEHPRRFHGRSWATGEVWRMSSEVSRSQLRSARPSVLRGYINLASTLAELGELARSFEVHDEGSEEAERIGAPEPMRWLRAERIWDDYCRAAGTKRRARRMRSVECRGGSFAIHGDCRAAHSRLHTACARRQRGGVGRLGAVLGLARAARIPRLCIPALAFHSHILLATGHRADAGAFARRDDRRRRAVPSGLVSHWVIPCVVVLKALGRGQQLEEIARNATISTQWLEAALAYASDAFRGPPTRSTRSAPGRRGVRAPARSGGARRGRRAARGGQRPGGACARLLPLGRRHRLRARG